MSNLPEGETEFVLVAKNSVGPSPKATAEIYLQEGAEIAKRSFHDNYDIIISRGGTAELIGQIYRLEEH